MSEAIKSLILSAKKEFYRTSLQLLRADFCCDGNYYAGTPERWDKNINTGFDPTRYTCGTVLNAKGKNLNLKGISKKMNPNRYDGGRKKYCELEFHF